MRLTALAVLQHNNVKLPTACCGCGSWRRPCRTTKEGDAKMYQPDRREIMLLYGGLLYTRPNCNPYWPTKRPTYNDETGPFRRQQRSRAACFGSIR
jgi:hypothetical protein